MGEQIYIRSNDDVQKLVHGVYRVQWRDSGLSLAAVGSTYDGTRWLAPTNWTTRFKDPPIVATTDWSRVYWVELIERCPNLTDSN